MAVVVIEETIVSQQPDAEKVLLERGSKQEFLWGGEVDLTNNRVEFVALINMRPRMSRSQEVLDQSVR